jgi:hypothetical protein
VRVPCVCRVCAVRAVCVRRVCAVCVCVPCVCRVCAVRVCVLCVFVCGCVPWVCAVGDYVRASSAMRAPCIPCSVLPVQFRMQMQELLSCGRDDGRPWPSVQTTAGATAGGASTRGGAGAAAVKPEPAPHDGLDAEAVEQRAMTQWQGILRFLANDAVHLEDARISELLQRTGLVAHEAEKAGGGGADGATVRIRIRVVVTAAGYAFMLRDVQVQLWLFLSAYLSSLEDTGAWGPRGAGRGTGDGGRVVVLGRWLGCRGRESAANCVGTARDPFFPRLVGVSLVAAQRVALVSLLFQLSFCVPGDVFEVSSMAPSALPFLHDLQSFGVLIRSPDGRRWVTCSCGLPSRLPTASSLCLL